MTSAIKNLTEIPASVIARTVRKELKAAFPGIKFAVSGTRGVTCYIQSGTITVEWTDGPTTKEVDAITKKHIGIKVESNPYTDYRDAERIDNGDGTYNALDSIYTRREASEELLDGIVGKMMTIAGVDTSEELNAAIIEGRKCAGGDVLACIYRHFQHLDNDMIGMRHDPDNETVSRWAFHQHDAESLKALVA